MPRGPVGLLGAGLWGSPRVIQATNSPSDLPLLSPLPKKSGDNLSKENRAEETNSLFELQEDLAQGLPMPPDILLLIYYKSKLSRKVLCACGQVCLAVW